MPPNIHGSFDTGLEDISNLAYYPGHPFEVACNHEVSFDASTGTFSNDLSFQHVPPALYPFSAHGRFESSNFEPPITPSSILLASSPSERPQPVPRFQPSPAPILAIASQTGRSRYLECPICFKIFKRIARANACLTAHLKLKPYVCDKACGNPNCESEYSSIETLRRHRRSLNRRNASCPKCDKSILKQNLARHKALCKKSRGLQ